MRRLGEFILALTICLPVVGLGEGCNSVRVRILGVFCRSSDGRDDVGLVKEGLIVSAFSYCSFSSLSRRSFVSFRFVNVC